MKNFKKVVAFVLLFSFLSFNTSVLVLAEEISNIVPSETQEVVEKEEVVEPTPEIIEEPVLSLDEEKIVIQTVIPQTATINATKIVCDSETDLPNWGAGGHTIDSNTVSSFLDGKEGNCHVQSGWKFEWGVNAPDGGPATIGHVEGYTAFTAPTDANGVSTATIPVGQEIHVREVLQAGYIPFTGQNTTENVSAEFYCSGDTLNYDNWDFIRNPVAGTTYDCVAFNAPVVNEEPQQCDPKVNLIQNGDFETPALSNSSWDIIENSNPVLKWLVAWVGTPFSGARLGLEIQNNVAGSSFGGVQHAELDGDAPNTISQTIPTIPGKQYSLTFKYSARPTGVELAGTGVADDNAVQVKINDAPLGAVVSDAGSANTVWQNVTRVFTAVGSTTKVEISDAGTSTQDGTGGYIDNVSLNCNQEEAPQVSTVKMCKFDNTENPLSNWQLMLAGESVGSTDVFPDGNTYEIAGVQSGDYILKATGSYTYRPGVPGAAVSDSAYSKRDPSDAVYQTAALDVNQAPYLPWVRENNFTAPYQGWLGIMYNNAITDWGSIFNPSHIYALGTSVASTSDLPFKILDNAYSDNSGSLNVEAFKGYTGMTGGDGCVTFSNVPYGTYTADEIMKEGWTNVSGTGQVLVDEPTETFTIVNQNDEIDPVSGYVHIFKFVNGVKATAENTQSAVFPMYTDIFSAPFTLSPTGWWEGHDGEYEATAWRNGGETYIANEVLNTPVVGASCDAENPPAYKLVGYSTGSTLENAKNADKTLEAPLVTVNGDRYIIVWNEKCGEVEGAKTLKVHLYKYLKTGDTISQIPNNSEVASFPMFATWKTANLNGGVSSSSPYVLGNYHGQGDLKYAADTAPMEAPADYTSYEITDGSVVMPIDSQSCPEGKYRLVGYKTSGVDLILANMAPTTTTAPVFEDITTDQYVIVINEKCPDVIEETTTNNTTVVKAADLETTTDIPTAVTNNSGKWFFYNDTNDTINNSLGGFVTGPSVAPIGTGSAEMIDTASDSRINIATYKYQNTKLGDIKSLTFSAYSHSGISGPTESPYLVFNVSFDGSNTWQRRLVYVPANNGAVPQDSWNTFDTINGGAGNWLYSGTTWPTTLDAGTTTKTWAQIMALYPNARVLPVGGLMGVRVGEPGPINYVGNVDKFVIGIKTGLNTHTETYDFEPTPVVEVETPKSTGSSGGSIRGASQGQVLGATTSCGIYVDKFLRKGYKNDVEAVKKLQKFLNDYMKAGIKEDGKFGFSTEKYLKKFQIKHADKILSPWGFKTPTGIFYLTTQTEVNNIMCPELKLSIPPLVPIETNPLAPKKED